MLTGNPVRREILEVTREPVRRAPARRRGGRQPGCPDVERRGPRPVPALARARRRGDPARGGSARLRALPRHAVAAARAPGDVLGYEVVDYDDDIETAYAGASVFVCRAGAVTCAELAVTGMPAVLVPLPGAPADHQTRNAMSLAGAGAAIVVRDDELDGARLDRELSVLLDDGARLDAMSRAARSLARRDAAARGRGPRRRCCGPGAGGGSGVTALDLREPRAVHIVGVGGAGMSAIATVLARMGHRVSGSDLKESATLARLRLLGVDAHVGHAADRLPAVLDAVVVSTAIPASNPEVAAAEERGVPVLRRAEALRALVATRRSIAVAGSHGKTTVSSMLALCLRTAGWHPSFVIGGDLNEVGTNAAYDDGDWLVVEADESDGTFLELAPEAALVTNVEPDHLDHYGSFDALVAAFERFLEEAPGTRVVCADDAVGVVARLAARHDDVRVARRRHVPDLRLRGRPPGQHALRCTTRDASSACSSCPSPAGTTR